MWYLFMVPVSQRALLTLGIDTIAGGTFSTVTRIALIIIITSATIIGVAYYLAYRSIRLTSTWRTRSAFCYWHSWQREPGSTPARCCASPS